MLYQLFFLNDRIIVVLIHKSQFLRQLLDFCLLFLSQLLHFFYVVVDKSYGLLSVELDQFLVGKISQLLLFRNFLLNLLVAKIETLFVY